MLHLVQKSRHVWPDCHHQLNTGYKTQLAYNSTSTNHHKPSTNHPQMNYKSSTKHPQINHKSSTNHPQSIHSSSQIIDKSSTNHHKSSQIIHKSYTNHPQIITYHSALLLCWIHQIADGGAEDLEGGEVIYKWKQKMKTAHSISNYTIFDIVWSMLISMANLKHRNSSRCINFIEYKQLATVRFNCEQHKMLIAECVSTSKRREHGLL